MEPTFVPRIENKSLKTNCLMKTIILMWNPEISDVSVTAFRMSMKEEQTTWEVRCHDRAEVGDVVYLVRCDKPSGGIVQRGIIIGEPVKADHWYKENAHSWYARIAVTHVMNSLTAPIITLEQLQRAIPGFKWDGGHSGRVLRAGWAKKLEKMWENYLQEHPEVFKGKNGYDFSKEAYSAQLEATLYYSNNTDIWLYVWRNETCITRVVNIDQPEEEIPGILVEDGREVTTDMSFPTKKACKAFQAKDHFELFRILVDKFSGKNAIEDAQNRFDELKIKYELDVYNDYENKDDDENRHHPLYTS